MAGNWNKDDERRSGDARQWASASYRDPPQRRQGVSQGDEDTWSEGRRYNALGGGDRRPRQGGRPRDDSDIDRERREEDRYWRGDDRGFMERTGDEVRSWFGDDDAERRRREDERRDQRSASGSGERGERWGSDRSPDSGYTAGRGTTSSQRDDYGQSDAFPGEFGGGNGGSFNARGREAGRSRQESRGGSGRNYGPSYSHYDEHYQNWRSSQIEALDRDYDEFRRQRHADFDREFSSWRQQRQASGGGSKAESIREHMEVVGLDGKHVGTVDKVEGNSLKLTKTDRDAHGKHHGIPLDWVSSVDSQVRLNMPAEEAERQWREMAGNERTV